MVINDRQYPTMCQWLSEVGGVAWGPSEMSFSYCSRSTGEEYSINHNNGCAEVEGVQTRARRVPSPTLVSLFSEIVRFCRTASHDLVTADLGEQTLGAYLEERCVSEGLRQRYILPMSAALWSAPPRQLLQFPAAMYLRFLDNHGLLTLGEGLSWHHIRGGSRNYVEAVCAALQGAHLLSSTPVIRILRHRDGVVVQRTDSRTEHFDAVVLATHADQALTLLSDPSTEERVLLGAIQYQRSVAVLHWDETVMPRDRTCWASWNYERESCDEPQAVCVTYHLNRLQDHRHTARQYFVTLNRRTPVDDRKVLAYFHFEHPVFDIKAMRAQQALATRALWRRTCFAGSYLGYGFHEDAVASGVAAARAIERGLS
jgi:predicted NAD/FAD-binding protein